MQGLKQLNEGSQERWSAYWDEFTGLPRSIRGNSGRVYGSNAEEAALAFVNEHKALFTGLVDSELIADYSFKLGVKKELRLETAVTVDACYKGVKIHDGMIGVYVKKDGTIWLANNSFRPVELSDVTPALTATEVEELIRQAAGTDSIIPGGIPTELCIYPASPARVAYFSSKVIRGVTWHFILDASSGQLLVAHRLAVGKWSLQRSDTASSTPIRDSSKEGTQKPSSPYFIGPPIQLPATDTPMVKPQPKPKNPRAPQSVKEARERLRAIADQRWITKKLRDCTEVIPQMGGWFQSVDFSLTGLDQDGDGYCQSANIDWDADTYSGDSTLVRVEVWAETDQLVPYLMYWSEPYYIVGSRLEPWMGGVISVPYQGEWSFWLELHDAQMHTVLDVYPLPPEWDERLIDVSMESGLEDVVYLLYDADVGFLADVDDDGFYRSDTLLWRVHVGGYKDTTLGMTAHVYARD
jgi:hypothetical protein